MTVSWITCNYHNTSEYGNQPVNLTLVETFVKSGLSRIEFRFQSQPSIFWDFVNDATRDKEHTRIMSLIDSRVSILN